MAYLVLVRHGLSEWNKQGLWTGWTDIPLAPEGVKEAKRAGETLRDIHFDYAYTSDLTRAKQTLHEILNILPPIPNLPTTENPAFRERNYGIYTGKNKWQIQREVGEEEFQRIRRSWNSPIPEGESLKQVYEREIPYFKAEIEPKLKEGKNIIITFSGNPMRALVKYLEHVSDEEISHLEIGTGEVYMYQIDSDGEVVKKEIRAVNPNTGRI